MHKNNDNSKKLNLVRLIEDQAKINSAKTVITYQNQSITFEELNSRANQLANYLLKINPQKQQLIAICMERSINLIVGLLAILKSGSAYLPLDPVYPDNRLLYAIEQAQASLIITEAKFSEIFKTCSPQILDLDLIKPQVLAETNTNLNIEISPEDLAYVIYTSGSTGKPKGVMISHLNLINFLMSMSKEPGLGCDDRLLALTTIAFDIAGLEIWLPILNGAELILADKYINLNPSELANLIDESAATIIQATPITWQMLFANGWQAKKELKLLVGGDKLTANLASKILNAGHELWNMYGPTETTVWSAIKKIKSDETISVGKAIDNTQLYILNQSQQVVTDGEEGELYIGGAGVAIGYINRPDLTAERFIQNPLNLTIKDRLYRTGDAACYLPNGDIQIIGRLDDQVKIRGYRIELGEIETNLLNNSIVNNAVVCVRENEQAEKQIIAYVILNKHFNLLQDQSIEASRISHWNSIYSNIYQQANNIQDLDFNVAGWNSSYTQSPIPTEEMEDWVNQTIHRIKSLKPKRILEIGCGSGLFLSRLASECETYVATDISADAIYHIQKIASKRSDLSHVKLLQRPADNTEGFAAAEFDTVIINSVIQYFPSIDYLKEVINKVAEFVAPNGFIFIGDVRNFALLRAFHTDIQGYKASEQTTRDTLANQINQAVASEEELLIAPEFFANLNQTNSAISSAQIYFKTGAFYNELTRFRYDAVLSINHSSPKLVKQIEVPYQHINSIAEIDNHLSTKPKIVGIKGLINKRIHQVTQLQHWLDQADSTAVLGHFHKAVATGIDPDEVQQIALKHSYEVIMNWPSDSFGTTFEVILYQAEHFSKDEITGFSNNAELIYANNPLNKELRSLALSQLNRSLKSELPDYMLPSHIVFLDEFPLTENGKVNKNNLPAPNFNRAAVSAEFIPARTAHEICLHHFWQEVLGIETIGVKDNFFELGGDSIRAIQLITLANRQGIFIEIQDLFIFPTIEQLAQEIENNAKFTEKRVVKDSVEPFALLEAKSKEQVQKNYPMVMDAYPLSPLQGGLLFRTIEQPDIYLIQGVFTLTGKMDTARLKAAWQIILARYHSLRTGFLWQEVATPLQFVSSNVNLAWTEEEVSLSSDRLESYLQEDKMRGFDLARPPLFRLHLLKQGNDSYSMIWTFHHLILDGWSLSLIIRQLFVVYSELSNGVVPEPKLHKPFNEYIDWIKNQDNRLAELFWHQYFEGFTTPAQLSIRKYTQGEQNEYQEYLHSVPIDFTKKLINFAKSHQITLSTLMQSAWAVLLSRYTQQEDVLFGVTLSGRTIPLEDISERVGLFINTVPMRLQVIGEHTILNLLANTHKQIPQQLKYAYYPLNKIISQLSQGGADFFDSILIFEDDLFSVATLNQSSELELKDLRWLEKTEYPLTLSVSFDETLKFRLVYATDRYDAVAIQDICENLEAILNQFIQFPLKNLQDLAFIPETKKNKMENFWNNTKVDNADCHYLHQLFETNAQLYPAQTAVIVNHAELSYAELNRKANGLAKKIIDQGITPQSMIAVCADRSIELVISILAILKSSCTYVALDPTYPAERLNYILNDTQANILITTKNYSHIINDFKRETIVLDHYEIPELEINPSITIDSNSIAYVMYTSGSTGQPKGVMNTHAGITNRLVWTLNQYSIQPQDRYLQLAAVGFDISIWEILFPISAGAVLVIAEPEQHKDIEYLTRIIAQHKITFLHFVPSLLELFLEFADISQCQSIKHVICGGELLSAALMKKFFTKLNAELSHAYGPTEAAISVTHWDCKEQTFPGIVPIGRPIANTQIYIFDKYFHCMPPGVAGEIYIGGSGLATGYLNQPEMTKHSFIVNPLNSSENLYRTGDLGCYLPDGSVEFLGRKDNQIKLYGHRIELAEIEIVMRKAPQVRDLLIIIREDVPNHKYLAAYILAHTQNTDALSDELRRLIKNELPEYMLPGAFVYLENWPLTLNGKIDRKALPLPAKRQQALAGSIAKATETEAALLKIWTEIFSLPSVQLDDNFFELGGDSIISIQLVSRARQVGLHFDIKDVFRAPSVRELAATVKQSKEIIQTKKIMTGEIALTPIQKHFFNLRPINFNHINQAVLLDLDSVDEKLLEQALYAVIKHHEIFSVRFGIKENAWLQTSSTKMLEANLSNSFSYFFIDEQDDGDNNQFIQTNIDLIHTQLDITNGPTIKTGLFLLNSRPQKFLIVIHHLIVDTVSWQILLQDLEVAYLQLMNKESITLNPPKIDYQEWSEFLRNYSNSDALKRELSYWQNQCPKLPAILPVDFNLGKNTVESAAKISFICSAPNTNKKDLPIFLLSALAHTLSVWTGNSDLFLTLEAHGRELLSDDCDPSHTLGWFTSLYSIYFKLSDIATTSILLKEIKEQLKVIPNKGIGFGILKYLSTFQEAQILNKNSLPQISFNYLGQWPASTTAESHFKITNFDAGKAIASNHTREHLIEVEVMLHEDGLHCDFIYSTNHFKVETLERVTQDFKTSLAEILMHSQDNLIGSTPSDYPLAKLNQLELDKLISTTELEIDDLYPLAPTQAGLLFNSLLEPEADLYFVQGAFELKGVINSANIKLAWQQVVNHYPILRTGFKWDNLNEPLQYVAKTAVLPWSELDWTQHSELTQLGMLDDYLAAERQRPFDLATPPLIRLHFIKLSDERAFMIWSQHHILLDGWCLSTIMNNVVRTYANLAKGVAQTSFEKVRAYSDYIAWLSQQSIPFAKDFWTHYLAGIDEPTLLHTLFKHSEDSLGNAEHNHYLTIDESNNILQFAKVNNVTLNTVFQCAWGILLSRYLQRDDVKFGVTVSGRAIPLEGVENILGLFINTLPLRFNFSANETTPTLLARIQREMSEFHSFSYTSLASVQSWSQLTSERTLFDTLFIFENYPMAEYSANELAGFQLTNARWIEKTEYPLTLTIIPGSQIRCHISYKKANFNNAVIQSITEHFSNIVNAMMSQPASPITSLSILTNTEINLLDKVWNLPTTTDNRNVSLSVLFEEQVRTKPDAIAVKDDQNQLTYLQLNLQANQLAHYLKKQGVQPETLVGICLNRNIDLIVALLAVIKVGSAYLPLDAHYPDERLHYILEHAKTQFLISESSLSSRFTGYQGKLVYLDNKSIIEVEPITNLKNTNTLDTLLYAIYTSGSTGKPKGVLVTQANIINFLMDMKQRLEINSNDCCLSITTITFDIAGLEIFLPLITGSTVYLASRESVLDADLLKELITNSGCTWMQATPATWRMLINSGWIRPADLKVLTGGEALPNDLAKLLIHQEALTWNLYGPTETTIWSTASLVTHSSVNIGKPITNTAIYILDKNLQRTPIGIPGEICIAGHGLARGYLHQPELTAERFTHLTLSPNKQIRIYKTGDIGRFLPDGNIECLGRSDHQIKLRGYRIELGEIESLLNEHELIKQAIVIPYQLNENDTRLVAHIVPNANIKQRHLDFSLFYFSAYQSNINNPYHLLFESAKFADNAGFKALWTPERHFHPTGGQYPNPSLMGAALAMITQNIALRAGSVVMPLHNPLRIAEEWSVVDNLSMGRVGIAFAAGWNPKDFAFFPENYAKRKEVLFKNLAQVKTLWQGGKIPIKDGLGNESEVGIYPKPKQAELPIWFTAGGGAETFVEAGTMGANLLTHLLGQTVAAVAEKIALYRKALTDNGFDSSQHTVTIMLHTFVWDNTQAALEISKQPFCNYLKAHLSLENMAKSVGKITENAAEDENEIIEAAFERYTKTASLIGSVDDCLEVIAQLKANGVDEIACFIDFGIEEKTVLQGLTYLDNLRQKSQNLVSLDTQAISNHLQKYLPDYMIPQAYVKHDVLPMTFNGKIDRKALEQQSRLIVKSASQISAPQSKIECQLAEIWHSVLGVAINNVHDNFFALGGHSLFATQVISRIRSIFSIEMPIRNLFTYPTISELALQIEQAKSSTGNITIPSITRGDPAQLSFAQQRLWFLNQLEPNKPLHNTLFVKTVQGDFNHAVFKSALNAMVERHAVLRTVIKTENNIAYQVVLDDSAYQMNNLSWINDATDVQTAKLAHFTQELMSNPFDLEKGPLFSVTVIQTGKDQYLIVFLQHHIIFDGWSRKVFLSELATIYNSKILQQALVLPLLPIQYLDFAVWQRQWLQTDLMKSQLSYWIKQLADLPDPLALPFDYYRPSEMTHTGNVYYHSLSKPLTDKITQFSQQQAVTPFMFLLAVFQLLLHRYSGENDIVIGTPIANRHYPEVENLIGFFVNTLALRINLASDPTFNEMLNSVKQLTLDAFENQDIPFEQLVEVLNIPRELNRHPIFQIMFAMQEVGDLQFDLVNAATQTKEINLNIAQFDLTLSPQETATGFVFKFEYAEDLFAEETIQRMALNYETLMESILKAPGQAISQLEILSNAEKHKIVHQWNETAVPVLTSSLLQDSFESYAKATPDQIAVIEDERSITYGSLNTSANQLANYLQQQGVKSGDFVAICMDRSFDSLIGMLAIMKAGAVYIPLDPTYPEARLDFILEDTAAEMLLTTSKYITRFKHYSGNKVLLDNEIKNIAQQSEEIMRPANASLAYVIYTSGTTGKPKGVPINHHSIVDRINWCQSEHSLSYSDRFLHLFSFSFDGAVLAAWWPLSAGATLVLPSQTTLLDIQALNKQINALKCNNIFGTPTLLNILAELLVSAQHDIHILVGGEKLTNDLINKVKKFAKTLYNLYGPTECTVICTAHKINLSTDIDEPATIGKPIANTKAYILDKNQQPVPVGVVGELYIGGNGVARGYLNRPEITNQCFRANPFNSDNSDLIYRTGDYARYQADGHITYINRRDNLIKLRGYRIELDEITQVLVEHPLVKDAATIASAQSLIIAYITSDSDSASLIADVRQYLIARLPEYMLPNAILLIDTIPVTSHGKTDNTALLSYANTVQAQNDSYIAPRNYYEYQLVRIWEVLLNSNWIGVQQNFFECGGHSLLIVRLVAEIEKVFNKTIQVIDVFRYPTIAQQAKLLEQTNLPKLDQFILPIQTKGTKTPLILIHPASGIPFAYNVLSYHFPDRPIYAIANPRFNELQNKFTSIEEMAENYCELISELITDSAIHLGGWSFGGLVAYEIAKKLAAQKKIKSVLLIDTYNFSEMNYIPATDEEHAKHLSVLGIDSESAEASLFMQELIHNERLAIKYKPDLYLGKVVLFAANEAHLPSMHSIQHGWSAIASEQFKMIGVPGNHYELFNNEYVKELSVQIENELSKETL